ncbi:transmembrane protein 11, mitochondrial isoform X1 [Pteropus alecto]|uniref:Transmembrane protein 11, mitochondrial isoform X2 n=1 Tax=Pteropus vampyrus TaxID=132908 RepID=A0A6P3R727_PTEVA|nr:transmembrane protein 11, mitochondrial isoform X2 [Pteropus vampyrus]XP_015442194.1 transmembrane protein 11, mitochondrial isoform X1 [Pteropus alecto]
MGPWSGGLGTPALDHIPIQAQLSEEKRDGLMSRKLRECLLGTCHIQAQCWGYHDENTFSALKELEVDSLLYFRVSLSATDCYIVHEIYNGENAQDQFEYELEQALEAQYKYIVIEPTRIGDETARWITVGNCLHKTTVLAGTACLFTPLALPLDYSHYISLPAGVLSLACCTLYGISWQFDPCCKYQVEYDAYKLSRLPLHTLTSSTPVVLVRKDDLHRKRLHNTIALAALVYCVKKIYELYAV